METIQTILEASVSGGFWKFMGYWIIISTIIALPIKAILFAISRTLRHRHIMKHGYPPIHCDGDGDFKEEKDN